MTTTTPNYSRFIQKLLRYSKTPLLVASCICCGIGILLTASHFYHKNAATQKALQYVQQQTKAAATEVNKIVTLTKNTVTALVEKIEQHHPSAQQVKKLVQEKPTALSGLGVAFQPAQSPTGKRLAPYCTEQEGKQNLTSLDYDYTQDKHAWYHTFLKKTTQVNYTSATDNPIILEYGAPFYYTSPQGLKETAGVVFANQRQSHIAHVLSTLFLGKTGYWFIVDDENTIVTHPLKRYNGSTLETIANKTNTPELKKFAQKISQQSHGLSYYTNEITNEPSWLSFEKIAGTTWTLCGVFDLNDIPLTPEQQKRDAFHISLAFTLALCFLLMWYSIKKEHTIVALWLISFSLAGTLATQIGIIWHLTAHYPLYKEPAMLVRNKHNLYTMLDAINHKQKHQLHEQTTTVKQKKAAGSSTEGSLFDYLTYRYKKGMYIPTGIFINALTFLETNQVEASFLIWQRYSKKHHANVQRGFLLPQATQASRTHLYTTETNNSEIIVWQVKCTLNQRFDFTNYPFDMKDVHIQITPKDFSKSIVLVPDLDAYYIFNPHARPGISPDITAPSFVPEKSFFSYKTSSYQTNFGVYAYGPFGIYEQKDTSDIPDLYFTVLAQRQLIDTLITDLLPIFVIATLLFIIMLTSVMQGYAVFGSCATIFFGLIVSHLRIREKIPPYELVYFESLFLVMYFALMLVSIASLLYLLPLNLDIIQYRKNLLTKLAYWPLILGATLLSTLYYLY